MCNLQTCLRCVNIMWCFFILFVIFYFLFDQVKKKLAELVAGLITAESSVVEMTEEAPGVVLSQELERHVDVVESECDHVLSEKITSKPEGEEVNDIERENTVEQLDKMQCSMENLVCPLAFTWICNLLLVCWTDDASLITEEQWLVIFHWDHTDRGQRGGCYVQINHSTSRTHMLHAVFHCCGMSSVIFTHCCLNDSVVLIHVQLSRLPKKCSACLKVLYVLFWLN